MWKQDLTEYRQIFEAMQECGLVLHIHGEAVHASALSAEASFLPTLYEVSSQMFISVCRGVPLFRLQRRVSACIFFQLRRCFPSLKIVLEHVSTAAGVHAVKGMPNTAATITAHHLRVRTEYLKHSDLNHVHCRNCRTRDNLYLPSEISSRKC